MVDTRRSRPPPQQKRRGGSGRELASRTTGLNSGGNRGHGDNYRPGNQQFGSAPSRSDFTFTSSHQGPQFPPATTVQRGARRNNNNRNGASGPNNGRPTMRGGDGAPANSRGGRRYQRGGFRPQAAHERALLQSRDDGTEHFLGVAQDTNKFRDLASMSDDEEADMDVETDDSDGDDAAPKKTKLTRTQSLTRADGDSVPKWSNPDPYTVLPPPEETTGKRIDVVKLIRKAKNQLAEQASTNNAVAANDDFISFGDDDGDEASELLVVPNQPMPHRSQPLQGSLNEVAAPASLAPAVGGTKRSADIAGLPARPVAAPRSRKRKQPDGVIALKEEWVLEDGDDRDPAPWAYREDYKRLLNQPDKL